MQKHSRSSDPQYLEEYGWNQCDRHGNAKQSHDDPDEPDLRRGIVARELKILILVVVFRVSLAAHSIPFLISSLCGIYYIIFRRFARQFLSF